MPNSLKIDDTNKAIIKQLCDGRKPFSNIAEELSVTENTVRSRVNKLIDDKVLEICGLVDPNKIPGLQVVMMGLKVKTLDLELKAKQLAQLKGVINVSVVTGRYDLIVQLVLDEDNGLSLLDFFKNQLNKIDDIAEVETFIVYQSENLKVPYLV